VKRRQGHIHKPPESNFKGLVDLLNYRAGETTPEERQAVEMEQGDEQELDAKGIEGLWETEVVYDPEAPGLLQDPDMVLACSIALRRFANAWLEADADVTQWTFRAELEKAIGKRRPVLMATRPPTVYFDSIRSGDSSKDGYDSAVYLFYKFITSSQFDRLARCARCQNYYFIRRRQRNRRYCSARCGRSATARQTIRSQHKSLLDAKLEACRAVIHQLGRPETVGRAWKRKVAERATKKLAGIFRGYSVTSSFISRHKKALGLED
jgi:hypothetical protein